MILAAVALFIVTQGLLYFRWATMREPSCVLIVETGDPLRGGEIEVTGPWSRQPYTVEIGSGGRYSLPFYLEPGRYTVRVRQHGQTLFEGDVTLSAEQPAKRMDLSELPPAPTTNPTAQSD